MNKSSSGPNPESHYAITTSSLSRTFLIRELGDAKGKQRTTYRQADIRTPYEALKALPEAESYLRPGVTFAELDRAAHAQTDLEAARELQEAREKLFAELRAAA